MITFSRDRMGIGKFTKNKDWILCVLIVLLGAILRIYSYNSIPVFGWTHDEHAFAWSGMSLIQDKIPTSWSWLPAYGSFPIETWKGDKFKLVTPWFDHPPLYGLIVGLASILGGADSLFDTSLLFIRIPSLIFSIASILLLYILARKLFGTGVAVLSSLIFATSPITVLLSRLAVSENLIVLLSLAIILSISHYFKTSKKSYLYLSAFLAGIASLTKVTGIFLVLFLFILLVYKKKWRDGIITATIGLIIFSTYFIYGWIYDFGLFMSVLTEQSARFDNLIIFGKMIFPSLKLPFLDIWFVFGWLILIPALIKEKKYIISLPIIAYLFILIITGAQGHYYPWYNIPFYPFLSLALGIFLYNFMKKSDFLSASLIILLLVSWSLNYLLVDSRTAIIPAINFDIFKYIFIFLLLSLLGMYLYFSEICNRPKHLKKITIFLITISIISNIIIVFNLHNFYIT